MTDDQAPVREVTRGFDVAGPRGGHYIVMTLSCGHSVWRHGKKMLEKTRCMGCWLDKEIGKEQHEMTTNRQNRESAALRNHVRDALRYAAKQACHRKNCGTVCLCGPCHARKAIETLDPDWRP